MDYLNELLPILREVCSTDDLTPQTDLIGTGLLDSFGLVELLERLEDSFGVEVYPTQVPPQRLRTAEEIAQLLEELL